MHTTHSILDNAGIEPREERLMGWPHTFVRWYARPDAPTQTAVGIAG